MRFVLYVSALALLATGCSLRPRYGDFVTAKSVGKDITLVVIDTATARPVPGAKIEVSELKNRINTTTSAEGTFTLPIEKKYVDENSLIVVTLPKDVTSFRLKVYAPPPPPPVQPDAPAPVEESAVDAGVSNG